MTEKSYPNIYRDEYQEIISQLMAKGAYVYDKDGSHFSFDLHIPLIGKIKGQVGYIEPVLKVYIRSKPILISNSKIFKELDILLAPMSRA